MSGPMAAKVGKKGEVFLNADREPGDAGFGAVRGADQVIAGRDSIKGTVLEGERGLPVRG